MRAGWQGAGEREKERRSHSRYLNLPPPSLPSLSSVSSPDAPPPTAPPPAPPPPPAATTTTTPSATPVPVTLVTGFLGAGKSTLVNHILTDRAHGLRIAVILNELGAEAGIERPVLEAGRRRAEEDAAAGEGGEALAPEALVPTEEWVELANGCLCCSAKSGFLAALEALLERRDASSARPIDYVLVETTGLADPGPAAAALWADDALEAAARVDGVIVVADARRVVGQMAEGRAAGAVNEAARQLAYADVVVLNKADLVSDERELEQVRQAVSAAAPPGTPIHATIRSALDPRLLLHRGTLDPAGAATSAARWDDLLAAGPLPPTVHDAAIGSVAWRVAHKEGCGEGGGGDAGRYPLLSIPRLRAWLDGLLWERDARVEDVYRMKGVLCVGGGGGGEGGDGGGGDGGGASTASAPAAAAPRRFILQAVHELYDLVDAGPWPAGEPRLSRLVAIGRGLGGLEAGFRRSVVEEEGEEGAV